MKWIYPVITIFITLTDGQTLISNTECPALDELVRVNAKNTNAMRKEIEELRKEQERLFNELSLQIDWLKSILLQSNGIIDCMWYKIMDPDAQNGVYNLTVRNRELQAYCDMETDGGGWTVIVSRDPGSSTDMNRSWQEYKHGFGNVAGPFYWIGNDNIHELTKQRPSEVYIIGLSRGKYKNMTVLSEQYKYRLSFDENSFEGSMRNPLGAGLGQNGMNLQGMAFTTYDSDNDGNPDGNCAVSFKGGWWYNYCGYGMTYQRDVVEYLTSFDIRPDNIMMIRYKKPK